jgi:hypothetical protein
MSLAIHTRHPCAGKQTGPQCFGQHKVCTGQIFSEKILIHWIISRKTTAYLNLHHTTATAKTVFGGLGFLHSIIYIYTAPRRGADFDLQKKQFSLAVHVTNQW